MYQTIIDFFQTNKGEEFTLGIGYLSGLSEVYGKGINSGRDGESFTDEEKEKLRSFGDDELSEYADNPVVSRKKTKKSLSSGFKHKQTHQVYSDNTYLETG